MKVPDVSYARSGDVSIAYQVVGEGPTDLVFLPIGERTASMISASDSQAGMRV